MADGPDISGRHPRSAALERYFRLWLERLGIDAAAFARLSADLSA